MARLTIRDLINDPSLEGTRYQKLLCDGYLVYKQVLPTSLVTDCLRAYGCGKCAKIAHTLYGPRAQRLQPLGNHESVLNLEPLEQLRRCADLRQIMEGIFPFLVTYAMPGTTGVLIEPEPLPEGGLAVHYMPLHPDWLNQKPHADLNHLLEHWFDPICFWQFNLALLPDHSLFLVPGSHQYVDLNHEAYVAKSPRYLPVDRGDPQAQEFAEEYWQWHRERGAVQVCLEPGDLVIYRATMRHGARYSSEVERVTFHDFCMTPAFAEVRKHQMAAWETGKTAATPSWTDLPREELERLSIKRQ